MDVSQYVTVLAMTACHGSLMLNSDSFMYMPCVHVFEGRQLQATWQRMVGGRTVKIFKVGF